jgi:cysteinyl-tRNA synthetase
MCTHYLGQPLDVHAGGMDLIFPHHENEIAQSEAAYPEHGPLANIWLHNGFVNVDKEKMSKSLGNFVTVTDVLHRNDPEGFRYFLLSAHYRVPIQFDTDKLPDGRVIFPLVDEAERRMDHAFTAMSRLEALLTPGAVEPPKTPPELAGYREQSQKALSNAEAALDDDLNTPVALASLAALTSMAHELSDLAQKRRKDAAFTAAAGIAATHVLAALRRLGDQLGLLLVSPAEYAARSRSRRLGLRALTAESIDEKVRERVAARVAKDFQRADAIRAELDALGIVLNDGPGGTEWTVAQ